MTSMKIFMSVDLYAISIKYDLTQYEILNKYLLDC